MQVLDSSHMCRDRQSECDIPEFCDGQTGNVSTLCVQVKGVLCVSENGIVSLSFQSIILFDPYELAWIFISSNFNQFSLRQYG